MRLAHEHETRPTFGDWFCDCHGCGIQARALAAAAPGAPIVLKFGAGPRRIVTAATYAAAVVEHGHHHAADSFTAPGDYVREVFVGATGPADLERASEAAARRS